MDLKRRVLARIIGKKIKSDIETYASPTPKRNKTKSLANDVFSADRNSYGHWPYLTLPE